MRFYYSYIISSLIFSFCGTLYSYQFDKCNIRDLNSYTNVLNTLNGRVKGECYNITVSQSDGSKKYSNVMNWLSIPYAEAPINENRFKDPVPKKQWDNIIDGSIWPKACAQKFLSNGSEDCLFLNIFVKQDIFENRNKSLAPILIFIHGGGLVSGNTAIDYYESSTLAAYGDIVVVTIQYRLDLFGFLHLTDSLAKGNQGFLDQNLALKWVFENADRFGGDRERITICGQSGGAFSVGYHLMYEKSWPYFRNAIMESGGPNLKTITLISSQVANERSTDLFAYLGCNSSYGGPNQILKCAQQIDANQLLDASYGYLRKKIFKAETHSILTGTHFPVVINNDSFTESIGEIIEKRKFKKCNIISGFNSGEFASTLVFLPITNLGPDPTKWEQNAKLMNSTTFANVIDELFYYYPKYPFLKDENFVNDLSKNYLPNMDGQLTESFFKILIKIFGDFMFYCPTFEMAEAYSKSGLEAYVYLYDHHISSSIYPEFLGSVHTDELPMLFAETLSNKKPPIISDNYWSSAYHNYSNSERKFNENFLNYWLNFIKYNNPNYALTNGLSKWNAFIQNYNIKMNLTELSQYLYLKPDAIQIKTGFASHKCQFWNYTNSAEKFHNIMSSKLQITVYLFTIIYFYL